MAPTVIASSILEPVTTFASNYIRQTPTRQIVSDVAYWLFIAWLFSFLVSFIYNVYFHPLAHIPGPFLARGTKLYSLWLNQYYGAEHITETWLHETYGPVVRKAPHMIALSEAKYLPIVYHRHAEKGTSYEFLGHFGIVGIMSHTEHAEARRSVAQPFTSTNVKKMHPIMQKRVDHWIAKLGIEFADTGKSFDFAKWTGLLAWDVMTELGFGKPFGFTDAGVDYENLGDTFRLYTRWQGFWRRLPEETYFIKKIPYLRLLFMPNPYLGRGLGFIMRKRDEWLQERLDNPTDKPDILNHLISIHKEGKMSRDKLRENLLVFILAGSDTVWSTFRALLINIICSGKYATLLQRDLRPENLALPEPDWSYLDACIKETVRTNPSVSDMFNRIIGKGGLKLDSGEFLPEGTDVYINPWISNRDKLIYGEDADEFVPERWLNASKEKVAEMDRFINTFGFGVRMCIGRKIAEQEMVLTIRAFFKEFEPTFVNPSKTYESCDNYGLMHFLGMWVKIKRREKL